MKRQLTAVSAVAILAVALLAPLTSAAGTAPKHVRIDLAGGPAGGNPDGGTGRFTLRLGAVRDAGTLSYSFTLKGAGTNAGGQSVGRVTGTLYLTGKAGGMVLVTEGLTYGATGDGAVSGRDIWTGRWNLQSASGAYHGLAGKGAFVGIAGPSAKVALRLDGHMG